MRIATVTAHYPPNFISGGTLVPHRIAEGFAARGHEVHVFAGSYQDGEPDMTVRTETTESGVQIQWTTITGMLAWDDDVNYSNNELAAEFARWIARVRPEVVHFHNLQGFGGSLVSIAAAAGAATVVTIHDMWWWCARQFLVDPKLRPCSTVVDCGVCPCEVDNDWLVDRNRQLAAHLRNADLVLAPSSTMIDLLSANGIDPARLALDENPAPAPSGSRHRGCPFEGTVRFVFAGGKHPVKGGHLAVEAARELGDLREWSLDLYGVEGEHRLPDRVTVLPPYDPDEVADRAGRLRRAGDVVDHAGVVLAAHPGGAGRRLRGDHRRQPGPDRGGEGRRQRPGGAARRRGGPRPRDAPDGHRTRVAEPAATDAGCACRCAALTTSSTA